MATAKKRATKEPLIPAAPVLELVQAAAAARDTFDTLRRGVHFSGPSYEKGYDRLRMALAYFNVEQLERSLSKFTKGAGK